MGLGVTLILIGLWLLFVGYRWRRLGERAAGVGRAGDIWKRELVLRQKRLGKAAPVARVLGWVFLAIGVIACIASLL